MTISMRVQRAARPVRVLLARATQRLASTLITVSPAREVGEYGRRVSANIRAEQARQKLTDAEVAARAGMSRQKYNQHVNDQRALTVDEAARIAAALDAPRQQVLD